MKLKFYTGTMGAGKSKHLIEKFNKDNTRKISLVAHLEKDTKSKGIIESRNGTKIDAYNLNCKNEDEIIDYLVELFKKNYKTFYIDEIQFLSQATVRRIINLSKELNLNIYFFGLTTTFLQDYFESSAFLLNILPEEDIIYIERTCETEGCTNKATHNARILNGKIVRTGNVFVEEKSKYLALCSDCYNE